MKILRMLLLFILSISYRWSDSASLAISEPNIEEEEAKDPMASSQSKTMSCSKIAKHKTRLKRNSVVSH